MPNLIPHFIFDSFQNRTFQGTFKATALFVDVSGYTAITGELMTHGKDGCEVLTRTLNGVLSPLVEVVYAYGGFITNFAGDAFIALFPDEQENLSMEKAQKTAYFIRVFFTHLGSVSTPYGNFKINVKVGLGSGDVEWGILPAGKKHTYYFRGSAIEAALEAESNIKTGEIGVLEEDSYRPLTYETQSILPVQSFLTNYTGEQLSPFVPDDVLSLTIDGEFRNVISVFITFRQNYTLREVKIICQRYLSNCRQF